MQSKHSSYYKSELKLRIQAVINRFADGNKTAFSKKTGVPRQNVANWVKEKGNSIPEPEKLMTICKTLGVSADWLLCGIGKMEPDISDRWDKLIQVWHCAWFLNPDYANDKLLFLYKFLFKKKINSAFKNKANDATGEKLKSVMEENFNIWAGWCEKWIEAVRELEKVKDTQRYKFLNGRLELKIEAIEGDAEEEMTEERVLKTKELYGKAKAYKQEMETRELLINEVLRLFE